MTTRGKEVESGVDGEEGSAVGDGAECTVLISLPLGSRFCETVTAFRGKSQQVEGAVASLDRVSTFDLLGRDGSDWGRSEACETAGGVSVEVSCTAGCGSDW